MSEQTAWLVLVGITAAGVMFWIGTTAAFLRAVRPSSAEGASEPFAARFSDFQDVPPDDVLTGHAEVNGSPEELSEKLALALGRSGLAGSLVKILERSRERVAFEVLGYANEAPSGAVPRRGVALLTPAGGGRSRIDYALQAGGRRWLVRVGGVLVVMGFVTLVLGFWLLSTLVVPNPNPAVRGQTVQMVQCVHVLWPPWLFGTLYRRERQVFWRALEVLVANLPFV